MGYPALNLTSKTAVVIGGTSGIGLSLAEGLAQAGANVVATGRRALLVQCASEKITRLGRRSLSITCDVTERQSLEDLERGGFARNSGTWTSWSIAPAPRAEFHPWTLRKPSGTRLWTST